MADARKPSRGVAARPAPLASVGVPGWDEAFLRVESYLRAHHVESPIRVNQLATDIIREAQDRVVAHRAEEPVGAALQVTHARIGAWFAQAGNTGDWSDERVRESGRLALVLADLTGHWGHCFLSTEPVPREFAAALISGVLQAGPELRFSNMSAEPLEFGFDDRDAPGSFRKAGWSSVRAAAVWLSIVGVYGGAWAASH